MVNENVKKPGNLNVTIIKNELNIKVSRESLSKNSALEKSISLSNVGIRRQHGGNA
jgi:hypothetical protein